MSKAFAFAGARVGYLAADPAFIDALRLVRLPYHLSALTQAAAIGRAAPRADDAAAWSTRSSTQRDRISATLEALGYTPHESWTNFVLFGGVARPARDLAGAVRPRRADPRRRHPAAPARHGGHRGRRPPRSSTPSPR